MFVIIIEYKNSESYKNVFILSDLKFINFKLKFIRFFFRQVLIFFVGNHHKYYSKIIHLNFIANFIFKIYFINF